MAATGRTENLHLEIFEAGDYTTWEAFNKNMESIDSAIGQNGTQYEELNTKTENNTNAIENMRELIGNTANGVQDNTTKISLLNSKVAMVQSDINTVEESLETVKMDMENLTDLVGDLPPNLANDIAAIKQKNQEQDTAIETAQSEANTATEAANNALNAVKELEGLKPLYENSIVQYATYPHVQYFNGSAYEDVSPIEGTTFGIQLNYLSESDDPYILSDTPLHSIHGVIYLNNQQISGAQSNQNEGIVLKPSASGTTTSALSAIFRYINERKTAWNKSDFALNGYIMASGESTSYPVKITTNASEITVTILKKGSNTIETSFNLTRAEIHF